MTLLSNGESSKAPKGSPTSDAFAAGGADSGQALPNIRCFVLLYVLVAGCWILFTDHLMGFFVTTRQGFENWSMCKGCLFVLVTGLLLYGLFRRFASHFERINQSLRASEKKYRFLVENAPDSVCISRANRVVFANAAALRLFGAQDEKQLFGKSPFDLIHPDFHPSIRARSAALLEGQSVPLSVEKIVRLDGGVLDVEASPVFFVDEDGPAIKVVFHDITERTQHEEEIRRLNRLYAVLSQVNQMVTHSASREQLSQEICRIIIDPGKFKMAWVGWIDGETHEVVRVAAAGEGTEALDGVKLCSLEDRPEGRGLVGTSIREGRPTVSRDYASDLRTLPWHPIAAASEFRSAISLPIRNNGKICGVLVVYSGEKDCFQTKEVKLFEEVALDISFALDHLDQEALRHQTQAALQKSEEQLRLLVDHLQAGVVVHDAESRIILSNPEAARLLGLSTAQMQGKAALDPAWRFVDEDGKPLSIERYPVNQVIASGRPVEEYIMGIEHGEIAARTWVLVNAYPEFDEHGALRQVVVTFVDMTERKRVIEALTESEEKYRTLFAASRDAILLLDRDQYLDGNQAALDMLGYHSKQQFFGTKVGEISAPQQPDGSDSGPAVRRYIDMASSSGIEPFEWVMQRLDGTRFCAEISLSSFELQGRLIFQAVVRDISWRKEAEQQLRQLSRAVEQSPSAVVITDTLGDIQYVNPKFTAVTGYTFEEALGKNPRILNSGEFKGEAVLDLWKTITSGREWRGIFHNKKKNGELFWEAASICPITDESGAITHYLAVKEDITERKQMEEKLLRAQRMESIGALAGGMAHDLNNILAPIMMSASMLHEKGLPEELCEQLLAGIEESAQRGANIVNQVLTFARGVKGERAILNLHTLATQVMQIAKETFPKSIAFSLFAPEMLWNVTGDATQLHQVLLNLCVNARDAMPEGGSLTLTIENCEVDSAFAFQVSEAKPGCYVKLQVADTGSGISHEISDRIFEPFFTTKELGKGTGLGLSTVIGILRSHGGFVTVDSTPAKGSTFSIFLPATTEAATEIEQADQPAILRGHGEKILIVDDETDILGILRIILEQNGWTVILAADGVEGLAAYLNFSGQIKAVITDIIMPNMDGLSLIRSIRKLDAHLPILVATGYGSEASMEELNALGIKGYLKKPFSARHILTHMVAALYETAH